MIVKRKKAKKDGAKDVAKKRKRDAAVQSSSMVYWTTYTLGL